TLNCRLDRRQNVVGRKPAFIREFVRIGLDALLAEVCGYRRRIATKELLQWRQARRPRDLLQMMLGEKKRSAVVRKHAADSWDFALQSDVPTGSHKRLPRNARFRIRLYGRTAGSYGSRFRRVSKPCRAVSKRTYRRLIGRAGNNRII